MPRRVRTKKFKHDHMVSQNRGSSYVQRTKDRWQSIIDALPTDEVKARFSTVEYNGKTAAISIETCFPQEAKQQTYVNRYEDDEECSASSLLGVQRLTHPSPFSANGIRLRRFAETIEGGVVVKHPEVFNKISDDWREWEIGEKYTWLISPHGVYYSSNEGGA